ncbi:MAG: sulfatase [Candidatus Cyclobacteriaceae bacterium M3_2C_046]
MKKYLLIFLAIFACNQEKNEEIPPPNIVFILVDDLGWSDIGTFGSEFYDTPNVDQLAAEGMKFTNAYAACPVCSPTRASIMTGKYPVTVDITDWIPGRSSREDEKLRGPEDRDNLALTQQTMAELLKAKGYKSISIGKWHLGGEGYLPTDQGFDINVAGYHFGSPPSYYYPYQNQRSPDWQLDKLAQKARKGTYLTDQLAKEAVNFINDHKDSPFLVYLTFYAVHIPLQPKDSLFEIYQEKARTNPGPHQDNPYYAAMVKSMDEGVGRVMKALEANDLSDNTLVFFMSDNGGLSVKEGQHTPATNNYPLKHGKGYLYEGGIREPMIVKWPPQVPAGTVSETVITSTDFLPTILEAAGFDSIPEMDGKSFMPVLNQQEFDRGPVFWHYPHYSNQGGLPGGVVRMGDYKLIEFYEDGALELYNLREDISEQNNLVEQMPDKAEALHQLLVNWRQEKKAKMPIPNPDYQNEQITN